MPVDILKLPAVCKMENILSKNEQDAALVVKGSVGIENTRMGGVVVLPHMRIANAENLSL